MGRADKRGFTLVEFVTAIVILGIVGAIAVPQFLDLRRDANVATLSAGQGSARTAAVLARVKQAADGLALNDPVDMGGVMVTMINGYPTPDAAGIGAAAGLLNSFTLGNWTGVPPAAFGVGIAVSSAATPTSCYFTYLRAPVPGGQPVFLAPVTGGC